MRARLIIKGNKFEAARAAADRGIGLAFEREVPDPITTVGLAESDVDTLNLWVCEGTRAPFPVGSLLRWTPVES